MIVLDTHAWIWWVHDESKLSHNQIEAIKKNEQDTIGVSIISIWEIAKLVEYNRLTLPCKLSEWIARAKNYPGIEILDLTEEIILNSTRLPGSFHKDPADQLIVGTARVIECPIVTSDKKIIQYPHVKTIS